MAEIIHGSAQRNIIVTTLVLMVIGALLLMAAPIPFKAGGVVALGGNQSEVWVNSAWSGVAFGTMVDGHIYGMDAFDTIQNGSNAVAPGGIVHVAPGTYYEHVIVDHSLIINGSNSGIAGNSSDRHDESVLSGDTGPVGDSAVSDGIVVQADNVVIDGMTIQGFDNGIASYANVNGLTVNNTRILDSTNGIDIQATSSTISDNYLFACSNNVIGIDGNGDNVINNVVGNTDGSDNFNYGVSYSGDSGNISLNTITATVITYDAVYCNGDNAVIDENTITVAGPSSSAYLTEAIEYTGNGGEIDNNNILLFGYFIDNMISVVGDSTSIDGNSILTAGSHPSSTDAAKVGYTADGVKADDSIQLGCMIYVNGTSSKVANNIIGQDHWYYYYGIYYTGKTGNVSYNDIYAGEIVDNAVYYSGDEGIVSNNTMYPERVDAAVLLYLGDSGTISSNDMSVDDFYGNNPVEYYGDSGAVDGNIILVSDYDYIDSANAVSYASTTEIGGAMVYYEGDSGAITNNNVGDSDAYYNYGVYYLGDSGNVSLNGIHASEVDVDAVYYGGDKGVIGGNSIDPNYVSDLAIEYEGNNGTINAGNDIEVPELYSYDDAIDYYGDNGTVDGNFINANMGEIGSAADATSQAGDVNATSSGSGARIYYEGSGGNVTNNVIGTSGDSNEYYNYGIYMNGESGNVSNNLINAYYIYDYAIYNNGGSAKINGNTVNAYYAQYYVIYNSGSNSHINDNTIDVDYVYYYDAIYNEGSSTTINGNDITTAQLGYYYYYTGAAIRSSANDVTINDNNITVTSSCRNVIAYNGQGGSINGNNITAYQCGYYQYYYYGYYWTYSDAIYYSGSSYATINGNRINLTYTGTSASYGINYNGDTASISDNVFNISGYLNFNIYYEGYGGTLDNNRDVSPYTYKRNFIYCQSYGSSEDTGYAAQSAEYVMITNNTGGLIEMDGDNATIIGNNISAESSEGIEAYGYHNAIIDNTVVSEYGIYSSGDEANISDNVLNANDDNDHYRGIEFYGDNCQADNNTIWNTNVGIEHYGGIDNEGSLSANGLANTEYNDYINAILAKANSNPGELSVHAAKGTYYYGSNAVISNNTITNTWDFGDMGVLVCGDNGVVENNNITNVYSGISYYNGANATVYNNTVDDSQDLDFARSQDYVGEYDGIFLGAMSGKVDSNTILGLDNGIDLYTASAYLTNNMIDGMMVGESGISGRCDNTIIANNAISNIYGGVSPADDSSTPEVYGGAINISPLDTYAPYGSTYIHDNELTNNFIQFALDENLNIRMSDNSIKGVDLPTVQTLIATNVLDRAFYKTDSNGALLIENGTGFVYGSGAYTCSYHLVPGWNLISVPLNVSDTSIEGFFPADVRSGMLTLWAWDASKQDWVFYGSDPNDWYYSQYPALTNVETGRGYWVEMNKSVNFTVEGTAPVSAPASPLPLVKGWNLVGLTGVGSSSPGALYPGAFTVWNWDPVAQNWVFYGSDPSDWYYSQYPALSSLHAGQGNWVEKVVV